MMRFVDPLRLFEFELPLGWCYDLSESLLDQVRFRWWEGASEQFGIQALPTIVPPDASDDEWLSAYLQSLDRNSFQIRSCLRIANRTVAVGEVYEAQPGVYRRHLMARGRFLNLLFEHAQRLPDRDRELPNIPPRLARVIDTLSIPADLEMHDEPDYQAVEHALEQAISAAEQTNWLLAAEKAGFVIGCTSGTVLRDRLAPRILFLKPVSLLIHALLVKFQVDRSNPQLPKMAERIALRALNMLHMPPTDPKLLTDYESVFQTYIRQAAEQELCLLDPDRRTISRKVITAPDYGLYPRRKLRARWAFNAGKNIELATTQKQAFFEESVEEHLSSLLSSDVSLPRVMVENWLEAGLTPNQIPILGQAMERRGTLLGLMNTLMHLESLTFYGADAARETEVTSFMVAVARECTDDKPVVSTSTGIHFYASPATGKAPLAEALIHHATATSTVGDDPSFNEAQACLDEADQLLGKLDDERELRVEWCLTSATVARNWHQDTERAVAFAERGIRVGESLDESKRPEEALSDLRELQRFGIENDSPTARDSQTGENSTDYDRLRRAHDLRNESIRFNAKNQRDEALRCIKDGLMAALTVSPFNHQIASLCAAGGIYCSDCSTQDDALCWYMALHAALDVLDVRRVFSSAKPVQLSVGESRLATQVQDELISGLAARNLADQAFAIGDRARGRALEQSVKGGQQLNVRETGFASQPPPPLADKQPIEAIVVAADYISRQCKAILKAPGVVAPLTFEEIPAFVKHLGTAVLMIQPVGNDRSLLLLARPGAEVLSRWSPIPLQAQKAAAEAILAKHQIFQAARGEPTEPSAPLGIEGISPERTLWEALFEPLADVLRENEALIVVPYREFSLVPFYLLPDSQGRTLIDRYILSLVPSLALLRTLRQRGAWERPFPRKAFLLGDPMLVGREARLFRRLDGAREEVRNVKEQLEKAGTSKESICEFIDVTATESAYRGEAAGSDLVHLACHGWLDVKAADKSYLVLTRQEPHDGLLMASEVADVPLDDAFVFLSACQTGQGRPTADGIIGLGRAFLEAGARAVVISLWKVSDAVSVRLVKYFYKALLDPRGAHNAASALREALQQTRQDLSAGKLVGADGTVLSDKPAYWAPFVVLGDAEAIQFVRSSEHEQSLVD